jgi:hypothetical protein
MRPIIKLLIKEEIYYGLCVLIIAAATGLQYGMEVGVRAFIYIFILMQPIIFFINKEIIVGVLKKK